MKSTVIRKGRTVAAVLGLGILLASCGGGGGTTTGGTTPGGTSTGETISTGTYLAYAAGSYGNQGLYLVDPSNPTSPIAVTTMPVLSYVPLTVMGGYNASNNSYTNLYVQEIDYVQASSTASMSGPLMKVSLVKNGSIPSPTQITSLTNVTQIYYLPDEINGINYMEVATSSNQYYLVNSKMGPTDNPIPLNNIQIIDSINSSNLSITGFLVQSGNTLEECNTNLSNCSTITNSVTRVYRIAAKPSKGIIFLCVDGYVDELSGSTLTSVGVSCSNMSGFTEDSQNIYAVDNNGNILELSFSNPNAGWQTIYTNSDGLHINSIYPMTQNYLIINPITSYNPSTSSYTTSLIAIPKNGGSSITLYTGHSFIFSSLSNQLLFIAFNSKDSVSACVWTEGSSSVSCTPNSYWAGESLATSGTLNFYSFGFTPYKILEVESTTGYQGGALYAVDPTNLSSQTLIGNIPSNYGYVFGYGIGSAILLNGYNLQNYGSLPNVFFANLSSNTLIQIPNTFGMTIGF